MSKKLDSTNFVKCVSALPRYHLRHLLCFLLSAVTEVPFRGLFRHKFTVGLPARLRDADAQCVISCDEFKI